MTKEQQAIVDGAVAAWISAAKRSTAIAEEIEASEDDPAPVIAILDQVLVVVAKFYAGSVAAEDDDPDAVEIDLAFIAWKFSQALRDVARLEGTVQ